MSPHPHLLLVLLALLHSSCIQITFGLIGVAPTRRLALENDGAGVLLLARKKSMAADDGDGDGSSMSMNTPTKKRKKKKKSAEPPYWYNENDQVLILSNGQLYSSGRQLHASNDSSDTTSNIDLSRKSIKFTIRGNPRVLKRHRTARGYMYNPSRADQDCFRECVLQLLPREFHPVIVDDDDDDLDDGSGQHNDNDTSITIPKPSVFLFPPSNNLQITLTFRIKRPRVHFVNSKPGPGRLKPSAPGRLYNNIRSDVDNLAKFVLDSLNELLYEDDRQVVKLCAVKVLDTPVENGDAAYDAEDGLCLGGTDVEIRTIKEEDL